MQTARLPVVGAVLVALLVPLFLFLHTGSRATAVCESNGFSSPEGVSLLPLGTKCGSGDPFGDGFVDLHPGFLFAALFLVGALVVVRWNRPTAR